MHWMNGAWNERLSEICMRAAEQTQTTFDPEEAKVLAEMYDRILTKNNHTPRTKEEIEGITAFWWNLQQWRRRFLERNRRFDTAEEVLNETDIQKVKRDWEDCIEWLVVLQSTPEAYWSTAEYG